MERYTRTTLPQARRRTEVNPAIEEEFYKKICTSQGERSKYHLDSSQNSTSICKPGLYLQDFPLV